MSMEIGAFFKIKRAEMDRNTLEAIRLELTLRKSGGEKFGFGPEKYITTFNEVADWIEMPRQYALLSGLVQYPGSGVKDATSNGSPSKFSFKGKLRDEQPKLVADFLSKIGKGSAALGGIFSAPCGTGKTVMSLKFLSELGRTAIILVHTEFLLKQWRESILKFTNIKEDEIGLIQRNTCEWKGKKLVLGMVESLVARTYEPGMYEHFGVAVLDEVHRHGALEWHKAIVQFPARIRVGLSATPRRMDGLWNIIRWHVGDVLTRGEAGGKAKVVRVPTHIQIPDDLFQFRPGRINLSRLITLLVNSSTRNQMIVTELLSAIKSGRRVLVLSDRLGHLEALQEMFLALWGKKDGVKIGHYVGGINGKQIEHARECNLLFGTNQYAKEGLDDPGMDTLFLTVGKSDVEQAVGRILRQADGKKTPLIIDFVDERVGPCIGFAIRRNRQYQRLGFEVVDVD